MNSKFSIAKRLTRPSRKQQDAYLHRNTATLLYRGNDFFSVLIKEIGQAKHCIHFQTYIFESDQTGTEVGEALIQAAGRGVRISLLVDGYASQAMSKSFIQKLKEAGIAFRFFEPLLRSRHFYFGRRLHHKVVVIDGFIAFVGSMNVADRYNDVPDDPAWFDLALMVKGEVSAQLHKICNRMWSMGVRKNIPLPEDIDERIDELPEEEFCDIRVRQNDWVSRRIQASRTYREFFRTSKERIHVVCSYFLPSKSLRRLLERRVRDGVKVTIVLAGSSDISFVKWAERYLYRWMLEQDIEVYEYQPTVLHCKMAVMDGKIVTLGSYNVNELSDYASIELNLDVNNKKFGTHVEGAIQKLIKNDCEKVDLTSYLPRRYTLKHLGYFLAFRIVRMMIIMTTFYFRRKE